MSDDVILNVSIAELVSPVTVMMDPVVSVMVSPDAIEVDVTMTEIVIPVSVNVGAAGLPGAPGAGSEIETYVAAVNLNGHRFVALNDDGELITADSSDGIPAIGVIRDAVLAGGTVNVYRAGKVNGFTGLSVPETYFLGESGLYALTSPSTGIIQVVGSASSASEMLVTPGEYIQL